MVIKALLTEHACNKIFSVNRKEWVIKKLKKADNRKTSVSIRSSNFDINQQIIAVLWTLFLNCIVNTQVSKKSSKNIIKNRKPVPHKKAPYLLQPHGTCWPTLVLQVEKKNPQQTAHKLIKTSRFPSTCDPIPYKKSPQTPSSLFYTPM